MLALYDVELKQTRFYQEIAAEERLIGWKERWKESWREGWKEGRRDDCFAIILPQLRRHFGNQSDLAQLLTTQLESLTLEQLETLVEALLDFSEIDDLTAWLHQQLNSAAT